ncbi:MAG: DNA-binding protein [Acidobacteria bacterium]|nr:MAG: DNA-binding protein [Acidobacteriota bacterium]
MAKHASFKVANCDLKETHVDPVDSVKRRIFLMRGQRVMMDHDLAKLYGVTTKRLNQQFTRNRKRFPEDFAFRLTLAEAKEIAALRLQNATLKRGQHIKHPPHVFNEHGAIMLASVLNSKVAVEASIYVVRAFVKMRAALMEYAELSRRIDELEARYDDRFQQVFEAIRALIAPPTKPPHPIGFIGPGRRRRKKED